MNTDETNLRLNADLPPARWPLDPSDELRSSSLPTDYNTPWPELKKPPANSEITSEGAPCSHAFPYVMRSKKFGSVDPDDDTAALTVDLANPDTWDRDDPPLRSSVAISSVQTGTLTPSITTAAHGIAVGETAQVSIVCASTPSITGTYICTGVDATHVTITVPAIVTVSSTGTMAIVCDGVTLGPEQRHYKFNSGSGTFEEKVFAREKKWDSCGELYYIGPEVIIQTAIISGSGSASGGLP